MKFIEQLKRPYERIQLEQGFKLVLPKQNTVKEEHTESTVTQNKPVKMDSDKEYIITVKKYMTQPGNPDFDFMIKFNKNIPMPFVTMVGTIEKETKGMYYMNLHAEPMQTVTCMRCGRALTHPVSKLYGLGPECGSHAYINPFQTEQELKEHLHELTKNLEDIKWSGWVIKSAIKEFKEK